MDRVTDIIEHEKAADATASTESAHRWRAAHLIFQEIEDGQTKTALGELIGKSKTHVLYMYRCWERVGRKFPDTPLGELPVFSKIYSSTEVRGEPEKVRERQSGKRDTTAQDSQPDKFSAAAWVLAIDEAVTLLGRHRVTWDSLEPSDIAVLKRIPDRVVSILKRITERKTSATTGARL